MDINRKKINFWYLHLLVFKMS